MAITAFERSSVSHVSDSHLNLSQEAGTQFTYPGGMEGLSLPRLPGSAPAGSLSLDHKSDALTTTLPVSFQNTIHDDRVKCRCIHITFYYTSIFMPTGFVVVGTKITTTTTTTTNSS